MDQVISATFWGFVSGGALVVGALIGYYVNVSSRLVAELVYVFSPTLNSSTNTSPFYRITTSTLFPILGIEYSKAM